MTSMNYVDEYVIQKVVTTDNTYESNVAPSDSVIILNQVITQALIILILTMRHRCQIQ